MEKIVWSYDQIVWSEDRFSPHTDPGASSSLSNTMCCMLLSCIESFSKFAIFTLLIRNAKYRKNVMQVHAHWFHFLLTINYHRSVHLWCNPTCQSVHSICSRSADTWLQFTAEMANRIRPIPTDAQLQTLTTTQLEETKKDVQHQCPRIQEQNRRQEGRGCKSR